MQSITTRKRFSFWGLDFPNAAYIPYVRARLAGPTCLPHFQRQRSRTWVCRASLTIHVKSIKDVGLTIDQLAKILHCGIVVRELTRTTSLKSILSRLFVASSLTLSRDSVQRTRDGIYSMLLILALECHCCCYMRWMTILVAWQILLEGARKISVMKSLLQFKLHISSSMPLFFLLRMC